MTLFANACEKMAQDKTGAIIVLERSNNLDFVKSTGDVTKIDLSPQILESIFIKTVRSTMVLSSLKEILLLQHGCTSHV